MIGLNLEIYLEIGLTLMTTTGQDLETDQQVEDTGIIAQKIEETQLQDQVSERYLKKDTDIEIQEILDTQLELETDLGRDIGTIEVGTIAHVNTDTAA